jgi:cellulose synthase/poly-beta-1,6-N-acetylglucosamine synthase-like glycosyltransferase
LGIRLTKGEIIAFLDGDCIPEKRWLEEINRKMSKPQIGMVYGKRIASNPPLLNHREIKYRVRSGKFSEYRIRVFNKTNANSMYLVSGQNMAIRRNALKSYKFDALFDSIGGEDIDMQWTLLEKGVHIVFDPYMVVRHEHPHSVYSHFKKAMKYGKSEKLIELKHPEIKSNIWWHAYTPNFSHAFSSWDKTVLFTEFLDYFGRPLGRSSVVIF